MKKYYVFNMRLAGFLMINKCKLYRIEHNLQDNRRDVYVFKNTPQLQHIIDFYNTYKEKILNGINNTESYDKDK